jgi:ABC-2 type transport system ATP-binding protein
MDGVTLDVKHLTKRYGARTAVDDLTFSASEGDVVGLLGPNGAGKTTTIRLLTTVLAPTSGEFTVAGHPWTAPAEIRRRVGVLPESNGYPAHQTGEEYLRFHARLYGMSRATARSEAGSALAAVGLDERAGTQISSYSRGMRQRLGIARALVNHPAVVFLDEPTLGLDPAGQFQVLAIVRDIARRRGATVILSTHTLPEVEEVCSRVLILSGGRVLTSGTVGEVIATAAVERSARIRVPVELVDRALEGLSDLPDLAVERVEGHAGMLRVVSGGGSAPSTGQDSTGQDSTGQDSTGQRSHTQNSAGQSSTVHSSAVMNAALTAVARVGVPVLSYELEGARLSDAFLKMTRTDAA